MKKKEVIPFKEIRASMGLFDFQVICIMGDYKHVNKYMAWKFDSPDFDTEGYDMGYDCRGKCFYKTGYVPVVWIPRKPKTPREYATLAHECLHAIFHLFEWASIPITRDTEEVMTHSMAHLINEFLSPPKKKPTK